MLLIDPSGHARTHLDLNRAPYFLYGVKYIDLVPLAPFAGFEDVIIAPTPSVFMIVAASHHTCI